MGVVGSQSSRVSKSVFLFMLCALLFVFCDFVGAQQASKIPRVGYISGRDASSPGPLVEAFRRGLRELGYIEGKNIFVEYRYTATKLDVFQRVITELVELKMDVIVVPIQLIATKRLVKTIPIVMISTIDPVANGLVDNLAHPGANITGFSTLGRELSGKRLELVKEAVPKVTRVGILRNPDETSNSDNIMREFEVAAQALKLDLQRLDVHGAKPDLEDAFKVANKTRVNAVVTLTPLLIGQQKRIADLAIKHRLPTMFEGSTWVEAGGLLSYSADEPDVFRRAATYVDKILKGTKPADLPVEQPTKFEFVINFKTAKQIGLTIPPNVLARADKVIR